MKKLLLTAAAVACAASVFAQGTIVFNNRVTGIITTHVYLGGTAQIVGNGTDDFTAGTTSWAGFTAVTGSGFRSALLAANGSGVAESSLTFGTSPTVASFRGGLSAGSVVNIGATLNQVPPDAAAATVEMFAWDARTGISDPAAAMAAWLGGQIAGGKSGAFAMTAIGGLVNTPPNFPAGPNGLQSFNIYIIPEPSTMALAGLGAAALLIFRRRK